MPQTNIDNPILTRIRGEFGEMPGMRLTVPEASRLWHLAPEACERLLAALVEQRLLVRTKSGAFIQSGN
jgi:Fic family protein